MSREVQVRVLVTDVSVDPPRRDDMRGMMVIVPDADGDVAAALALTEFAQSLGAPIRDLGEIEGAMARRVRTMRVALAGAPVTLGALEDQFAALAVDLGLEDFRP